LRYGKVDDGTLQFSKPHRVASPATDSPKIAA